MRYSKIATAVLLLFAVGLWVQVRRTRTLSLDGRGAISAGFPVSQAPPKLAASQTVSAEAPLNAAAGARPKDEQLATAVRTSAPVPSDRKLIRSAELSIELDHYDSGVRRAEEIADSLGGFVADARSTSANGNGERASGTLSLRVPADRFGEALRRLSELGHVRARAIQTQDVSREYVDLETRVRVKRDAEARMREVLRNRPAKLSDIVEAEQELTRIVEEIETMEGQRRFYDRQVALATVSVTLFEPGVTPPAVEPSFLEPIRQALRDARRALSSSVAGLIYVAAVGLPWAALAGLGWSLARRLRARRAAAAAATAD
jgi:hypothetical protein